MRFRFSFTLWLLVSLHFISFVISERGEAFPFQNFKVGAAVPAATFFQYNAAYKTSFSDYQGQPLVVLFWGADIPEKKQRSVKILAQLEDLKPFLKARHVALLSVNIQGDDPLTIRQALQESGSTELVFTDPDKTAYANLGIYVMPAILLLDNNGRVAAGFGYSRDLLAKLKGETEILLNEKTRLQVQQELQPSMPVEQPEKLKANTHFNAGLHLLKRGFSQKAKREFDKAIHLDPQLAEGHIELGCLYLESGNSKEAEQSLQIGLRIQPDSLHGRICRAQLNALQTEKISNAINDMEKLAASYSSDPEPIYTLGTLHEKQQRYDTAIRYYRKAYKMLQNRMAGRGHAN